MTGRMKRCRLGTLESQNTESPQGGESSEGLQPLYMAMQGRAPAEAEDWMSSGVGRYLDVGYGDTCHEIKYKHASNVLPGDVLELVVVHAVVEVAQEKCEDDLWQGLEQWGSAHTAHFEGCICDDG